MPNQVYMVIEHYKDTPAVYRRFREHGRMAPEGLRYVSSWVEENLERCFQVMETGDRHLLEEWMSHWQDLVDFEVYPVITSSQASEKVGAGVAEPT
jgi:hypothetical protein